MSTVSEKTRTAAAKRILKIAECENIHRSTQYQTGYWIHENNQYVANGYTAVVSNPDHYIADIPQNENNQETFTVLYSILEDCAAHFTKEITDLVPSVTAIKDYAKINKKPKLYNGALLFIGDDLVNTHHLLSVVQALPGARVYVHPTMMLKPIYFVSKYGRGIVLPIRPQRVVKNGKDAQEEFYNCNPNVNHPLHPDTVFYGKEWTRYAESPL